MSSPAGSARNRDVSNGKNRPATNKTSKASGSLHAQSVHRARSNRLSENGQGDESPEEDGADKLENYTSLRQKIRTWFKTPSVSHVLIIALLGSAGGGLAVPLETPVLREFACEWYFNHKDSKAATLVQSLFSLLPSSTLSVAAAEQRCNIPAIAKLAGEIITAARILNALVTVLCLTIYSDLLSRYGRKPMFAFTAFCLTLSIAFFGLGAQIRGSWGIALITTSFALTGLGSQPLLQLTFQSYIVECVRLEERSPAFALLGSATFAGLAASALASAAITEFAHIPLLPFWIGTGVFGTMFLYALLILPEALTEERREELMQANDDLQDYGSSSQASSSIDSRAESPAVPDAPWKTFIKRFNFAKKLSIFLPRMDANVDRRDYRLFLLAVSFTIYRIGSMYMNDLLLLTTTGSFGFNGVDNGLLISFVTACKAVLLMGVLPIAIRSGRKKYVKWLADRSSVHPTMEGLSESSRLLVEDDTSSIGDEDKAVEKMAGSERFDLYFGGLSFIIDAIAFSAIGLSRKKWQLYLSTALLSISAAGGPSAQAVATEVTPKAMSDQVLSGMSLIDEAGAILSPLVLGSIYSASTASLPSLAWFVAASLLLLSALIMLGTASIRWPRARIY